MVAISNPIWIPCSCAISLWWSPTLRKPCYGKATMTTTPSTPLPSSLQKPLDRFYEFLRSEKGLSLHTQRNYKQQLQTMAQHLADMNVKAWNDVDASWVRQLAGKGMREGMKASSLATRLSSLRSFFDFL